MRPILLGLGAIVALSGCSLLVGGDGDAPIRCEVTEDPALDPCREVFGEGTVGRCVDEVCIEVTTQSEACNGEDDDFDGNADEGLDNDGDGFTWCESGAAGPVDCVDTNDQIHPADPARGTAAPPEVCDGADNDCDGSVDEANDGTGNLCPSGQRCYPDRGGCDFVDCRETGCPERHACDDTRLPAECVLVTEDCTLDGCTGTQRCDPRSLMCIDPRPIGAACDEPVQCASDHCFSISALQIDAGAVSGATKICSAPCCSDADCPGDAVCWAPGTGARACVPSAILDAGTYGPLTEEACANNGYCPGMVCGGLSTSAYNQEEVLMTACRARVGTSRVGDSCSGGSDCASGMCIRTSFGDQCTEPCGSDADCPDATFGEYTGVCGYRSFAIDGGDADWLQVCDAVPTPIFPWDPDPQPDGADCDANSDCLEGACLDGQCGRTCCNDEPCGAGRICQPYSINGRWEMHCGPPD